MPFKVYEDIVECLTSDGFPPVKEGLHVKFVDTGKMWLCYHGGWSYVGMGQSYAPPTKSGVVTTDANGAATIVFGTHFADDNYTIALSCKVKNEKRPIANWIAKSSTGFSIVAINPLTGNTVASTDVSWLCTRNYNE
jgi:hypothetical protein